MAAATPSMTPASVKPTYSPTSKSGTPPVKLSTKHQITFPLRSLRGEVTSAKLDAGMAADDALCLFGHARDDLARRPHVLDEIDAFAREHHSRRHITGPGRRPIAIALGGDHILERSF